MKKITLLLSVFLVITASAHANPIDKETAKTIGAKFLNASTEMKNVEVDGLEFVTSYKMSDGKDAFYVFNTAGGFVIVAADDCATPILGYSTEGQFVTDDVPIQMQEYLSDFVRQIQYGIKHETFRDEKTIRQWELVKTAGRISESRDAKVVEPLLTTTWGQRPYYNALCPTNANGQAITGCVATAMGQIMKYWNYPEHGTGSHSYTPEGYDTQTVNFGETTYDWTNMPNALSSTPSTTQKNAVATLLYHCGVAVDMMYGASSSGAYSTDVPGALHNYFSYSNEMSYDYRQFHSNELWLKRVKACLDLERPIYYSGSGTGGHAFVCDGYDENDLLHFNWGWRGSHDGYFSVDALNPDDDDYNKANFAIFNIHPSGTTTSHTITVSSANTDYGTVLGGGTFTNGSDVTVTATANTGYTFCYWTEDGIIVSADATYTFKALYDRDLVAYFAETSTLCDVVYDFQDNFGDGWQTNMLVVTYANGLKEYMTLQAGHNGSFTRKVTNTSTINLKWVEGYYIEENQFFIKWPSGKIIYENTSPSSSLDVDVEINTENEGYVKYYFTGGAGSTWSDNANWVSDAAPGAGADVSIKTNVILDVDATVASLMLDRFDTIFISSSSCLTVTGSITQARRSMIVIEDGGQLVQNNSEIKAVCKKNVTEWSTTPTKSGWLGISSPVKDVIFDSIVDLASATYNVYRYNESSHTWENCANSGNAFSNLENGRGYIYRKSDDKPLKFKGHLNVTGVDYTLSYTPGSGLLAGFNLIGNPYSHNIYKGVGTAIASDYLETGFYTLKSDGGWEPGTDNTTPIVPGQAVLVQATDTGNGETLSITKTTAKNAGKSSYDFISISVSGTNHSDIAYAIFNDGKHGLNKIDHHNDDIQKVYIEYNDESFAVAEMNHDIKMFNLNFKAQELGEYTLKLDYQGDFSYIHLFDRFTEDDIDMLKEGEYTFIGSPSDSEARFVVRLDPSPSTGSGNGSGTFVYQNGNEIIVNGSGLLQVYDVQGRMVMHQEIIDNQTIDISGLPRCVYIFRLTGDAVRTQKVLLH